MLSMVDGGEPKSIHHIIGRYLPSRQAQNPQCISAIAPPWLITLIVGSVYPKLSVSCIKFFQRIFVREVSSLITAVIVLLNHDIWGS